jgi:hypothetical protein
MTGTQLILLARFFCDIFMPICDHKEMKASVMKVLNFSPNEHTEWKCFTVEVITVRTK